MSEKMNPSEESPARVTAYALGQLTGAELARLEAELADATTAAELGREIAEIQTLASAVSAALRTEVGNEPSVELRQTLESKLASVEHPSQETVMKSSTPSVVRAWYLRPRLWAIAATAASLAGIGLIFWQSQSVAPSLAKTLAARLETSEERSDPSAVLSTNPQLESSAAILASPQAETEPAEPSIGYPSKSQWMSLNDGLQTSGEATKRADRYGLAEGREKSAAPVDRLAEEGEPQQPFGTSATPLNMVDKAELLPSRSPRHYPAIDSRTPQSQRVLGEQLAERKPDAGALTYALNGRGGAQAAHRPDLLATVTREEAERQILAKQAQSGEQHWHEAGRHRFYREGKALGTEAYDPIIENLFLSPTDQPLSTFSIDVDTASYANVRRFLNSGRLPPPSAVRIEELVNYFTYSYPQPKAGEPFSVNMEAAECPWQPGHLLLRVGLKGKEVHKAERPASNLVFLLDVSGSMSDQNKLPLLKTAMQMLVGELSENDRVTIVTYAGNAGLVLAPTSGDQKEKIQTAIEQLSAGGSTNGSAGIQLAYEQAAAGFLKEGTNRVILATDGDLNVGVTSDDALVELIKQKAAGGVFLTVLGFGEGNLKDSKMEKLADNGNGIYAYIDGVREARKVLVEQMSGSLVTIAKDVKIQIEFNPAQIESYRLLGYENRVLAAEDFNNDKKDAGEIGAGHTVTALYQLVPVGVGTKTEQRQPAGVEPLKYQQAAKLPDRKEAKEPKGELTAAAGSGELLTLKLRYKEPDGEQSKLLEYPLKDRGGRFTAASQDMQFAAAVASFGMILRGSEHRGSGNTSAVAEIAAAALGSDVNGYRAEFMDLVRRAEQLGIK